MSFPRYPKYKPSGVEWLGDVPEHWEVKRLGHLCEKIGSGKTPSGGAETYTKDGVVFLRSQNVYDDGLYLDDVVYITEETDEDLRASRVRAGDILLNITGASLGRTCLVPDGLPQANVNQHVCIVRLKDKAARKYVAQSMKSCWIRGQIDVAQSGAAREGLNFAQISKLSLTFPPSAEQAAIAAFLDRETAKIDELVAEQRRLMELLKEKRQAVISHAVTKGLNPKVPMKPSGIEWLGDVPEHWELQKIKHLAKSIEQGWSPQCEGFPVEAEDEWGVLKVGCVNGGKFNPSENKALPPAIQML
jgi:type I restriction enzyme S subunit